MKQKWSRWLWIVAIFSLFGGVVVGLTSCGAADGLQNAAGGGDGPGSGNWKPGIPENRRQARQLWTILETLSKRTSEDSAAYDAQYVRCFDKDGNPLSQDENDPCIGELLNAANQLHAQFVDFRVGETSYNTWAQDAEDEDPPEAPDPPKEPKEPAPKEPAPKEPEDDDDNWGCPPWCCLTCTQNLDVEYVFRPAPVEVEMPSS